MRQPEKPEKLLTSLVQDYFHALTGRAGDFETGLTLKIIKNTQSLEATGLAIHRLGDSFSHRRLDGSGQLFVEPLGHLFGGHTPDEITQRPKLFGDYVETLAIALAERRGGTLSKERVGEIRDAMTSLVEGVNAGEKQFMDASSKAFLRGDISDTEYEQRVAQTFERREVDLLKVFRERAVMHVQEDSSGQRALLAPEKASASWWDAQGQELKNAKSLILDANGNRSEDLSDPSNLASDLERAAKEFVDVSQKCRVGRCDD